MRIFSQSLLEKDGDIPKVFRAGMLKKDTLDSFSELMSEIEDLERMQEMNANDPHRKAKMEAKVKEEQNRQHKEGGPITEEEDDDIMKELEELAGDEEVYSEGGNTSVDSQMEDTPSNYNIANQRYNELEDMKNKVRKKVRHQQQVPETDEQEHSEYSYLPDNKMKKKKKKKKKQKKLPPKEKP